MLRRISSTALVLAATATGAAAFNEAPPHAPNQQPAFAGQTRAPEMGDDIPLVTENIVEGLVHPWGMAELTGGVWVVTEKPGRMRLIGPDGAISAPLTGLPEVDARGQGGLLDVAVAEDFGQTRRLWWTFAEPREGGNATAVATGTLSADSTALENVEVIFQQQPAWQSDKHFGSRLVFDGNGALFVTTGERSNPEPRQLAQDVTTHLGKVLRINPEGGAASGNPQIPNGQPEIWSWGHRNLQSAALGPDGQLWTVEHGPKGGDELNRPQSGRNYGWPIITYGIDYSGAPIGEGITAREGMEQPVYYWDPVIGPSGMDFYDGDMFPEWQGDALIGGLVAQAIVRLDIADGQVAGEARHLEGIGRIRDVEVASDGSVMLLTDADNGALVRVSRGE
ncbi:PQQ-dependent sugar dehydrogenase (plasmid) [Paracoccus sp. TK19116]|uniref:PQQ-dependent sugar dehydrogenase n=1 Tax=Paracoccus albicereus TaxID=2922394 RepID=A0ABT1MPK9_9RHOB|nr:PQQ-dependent sugar dehydrogenase [Paracoccus albicereus]MCQ0969471.1 PQQ-dependent sugar dehydrogenase [Paracoccus albicereus]